MDIISVNIGQEREIRNGGKSGTTGIYKIPTEGRVEITPSGIMGDAIIDRASHGKPEQAVYVYGSVDYDWWSHELGHVLSPGTFGENLTISALESAPLRVGDRLQIGAVVLEITWARIPCSTLAARMGDPGFIKRFRQAERPGMYCRVITPGFVTKGDPVVLLSINGEAQSIVEMFRQFYLKP